MAREHAREMLAPSTGAGADASSRREPGASAAPDENEEAHPPCAGLVIIDHPDIDIAPRQRVIDRGAVVINCAVPLTGRYPAAGPGAILAAGILSLTAPARADGEHCPGHETRSARMGNL